MIFQFGKLCEVEERSLRAARFLLGLSAAWVFLDALSYPVFFRAFEWQTGLPTGGFSLFAAANSPLWTVLLLLSFLTASILYAFSFAFRLSGFAVLIGLMSHYGSAPEMVMGANLVLSLFIIHSFFMPSGCSRFEVHRSTLFFSLRVQLAVIYLMAVVSKFKDPMWVKGEAIATNFRLLFYDTPLGHWLAFRLPHEGLTFLSDATLVTEVVLTALILSPILPRVAMRTALAIIIPFHVFMMLFLHIGAFSVVMIGYAIAFYRSSDADADVIVGRHWHRRAAIASAFLLLPLLLEVTNELRNFQVRRGVIEWPGRATLATALRYTQRWSMFTLPASREWGETISLSKWLIAIEEEDREGLFDPVTGREIDWAEAFLTNQGRGSVLRKYTFNYPRSRRTLRGLEATTLRERRRHWLYRLSLHYTRRYPRRVKAVHFYNARYQLPRRAPRFPRHFIKVHVGTVEFENQRIRQYKSALYSDAEAIPLSVPWYAR